MEFFFKLFIISFLILQSIFTLTKSANSNLFREYIGSEFNDVKFSNVPINPNVDFHFILTFVVDYDTSSSPSPTNGQFNVFWDSKNLSPSHVSSIKTKHPNVKVALSLGGFLGQGVFVSFEPLSVDSWVSNAVSSLTYIIKEYKLDGIDINYQHFNYPVEIEIFAECIGQLVSALKKNGVISFASIAPFDEEYVQWHYQALWKKYGNVIDYVNFQFYTCDPRTTVSQFLQHFDYQTENYNGSKVLVSLISDGSSGLTPDNGFFKACRTLKSKEQLHGIFIWSADVSKATGTFRYEKKAQALLAKTTLLRMNPPL